MATITRTTNPPARAARSNAAPIGEAVAELRATGEPGEALVLEYSNSNAASTSRNRIKRTYGGDDLHIYSTGPHLVIQLVAPEPEPEPEGKGAKGKAKAKA